MGNRLLTRVFPDRGRQLGRSVQCRAVERQLQQRGVEHEHEHRCSPGERLPRSDVGSSRAAIQYLSFGAVVPTRFWRDEDSQPQAASTGKAPGTWLAALIYGREVAKTHNNLYSSVIDFDNLWQAYHATRKGKRFQREAAHFGAHVEEKLLNIHNHLVWETWQPGNARRFRVMEPKQRDIQAPPFEDRIVHHALCNIVQPLFVKTFIHHSYACLTDKGSQRAVFAVQKMMRRAARLHADPYIIKADISKYFASIPHPVLFKAIERTVSCKKTLRLWRIITRAYGQTDDVGLPVGALTSQLDANIMLDVLDHIVTDDCGIGDYVRYMDDFIIVAPSKRAAEAIMVMIGDEVEALGLRLNPKTTYFPANRGVDFAGYRIWTTHILPRKRNIKKARAAFRTLASQYRSGRIGLDYVQPRVASFLAYTKHCQAADTVAGVLSDFTLIRSAQ